MKFFVISYMVIITGITIYSTIEQIQPALFWIELNTDEVTHEFPVKIVMGLTWLSLGLPVAILLFVNLLINKRSTNEQNLLVTPDQVGFWLTRTKDMHAALLPLTVSINQKKIGSVSWGQKKFFKADPGEAIIKVGSKKRDESQISIELKKNEQPQLQTSYSQSIESFTISKQA